MAERRMHSLKVVSTDRFFFMPAKAQLLYYTLSVRGDDDGFVENPKTIMKIISCSTKELDILVQNGFIIAFPSGNIVISHWKQHNNIPKDRYKPSLCPEKNLIYEHDGVYFLKSEFPMCNNNDYGANGINSDMCENILNETNCDDKLENEVHENVVNENYVHENVMHVNDTHTECENVSLQDNISENVGCAVCENVVHEDNVYEKLVLENKVHNNMVHKTIVDELIDNNNIVQNHYNKPVNRSDTDCIQPDTSLYTQDRIGKVRKDKDREVQNTHANACENSAEFSSALSSSFSDFDFDKVMHDFNEKCSFLPTVRSMNKERKSMVKSAIELGYDPFEILRITGKSDFLYNKDWCDFDWIFKPENIPKILDGKFINKKTGGANNGGNRLFTNARETWSGNSAGNYRPPCDIPQNVY